MSGASQGRMTVRRGETLNDLRRIRDAARRDLLSMPANLIGSDWHKGRIKDIEWSAKRLAAIGVLSALAE